MKKLGGKKKPWVYILSFVITAFLILNCVWGIYSFNYANKYTSKFTDATYAPAHIAYIDGFSYSATQNKYLKFTNNLGVLDENRNGILIWIEPFSIQYGITIMQGNRMYQMYLDKDGKPTDKRNPDDAAEKYNENREIIEDLMKRANEFWSL